MQGAPPVDGFVDDGYVDDTDDGKDSSCTCAGRGSTHVVAQHDIADVDKPQDQRGGEAGVPCPPCAPGRAAPDGACEQGEGKKDGAEFSGSTGQPIPAFILLPEIADTTDGDDE